MDLDKEHSQRITNLANVIVIKSLPRALLHLHNLFDTYIYTYIIRHKHWRWNYLQTQKFAKYTLSKTISYGKLCKKVISLNYV